MECTVLTNTKDMTRDNWLENRRKGIGGSDVGAICGLNKWKSPVEVYLDKMGELPHEDQESEAAYWGNVMEDVVAKEFEKRTGKKVRRRNSMFHHKEYPWMLANIDRDVVGEDALLECKTASAFLAQEWKGDEIPESYLLQVQHYLAVTGYSKAYIAALIGGNKFICKEIDRDEELVQYLIDIEKDFWCEHVEKKIPPIMDCSEASKELMKNLYPESKENSEMLLDFEAGELVQKRIELKEQEKEIKEQLNEVENKLKQKLADNEVGTVDNYKVVWKSYSSSRFDSKKFKEDYLDLYKQYTKEGKMRKFDIKEVK